MCTGEAHINGACRTSSKVHIRRALTAMLVVLGLVTISLGQQAPGTYLDESTALSWDTGVATPVSSDSKEALCIRYPEAAKRLWGPLLELADRRARQGQMDAAARYLASPHNMQAKCPNEHNLTCMAFPSKIEKRLNYYGSFFLLGDGSI